MLKDYIGCINPTTNNPLRLTKLSKKMFFEYLNTIVKQIKTEKKYESALKYLSICMDNKDNITWKYNTSLSYCGQYLSQEKDFDKFLLQLTLYCSTLGIDGDFTLELNENSLFYFDSYPLKLKGLIRVFINNDNLHIDELESKKDIAHFFKNKIRWIKDSKTDVQQHIDNVIIQFGNFADTDFLEGGECLSKTPDYDLNSIRDAMSLISETSLVTSRWVSTILNSIVLVQKENNIIRSSSSISHNGLIYLTFPTGISHLACLIIHECSHLYFYLMTRNITLVNPKANELIYSPFKNIERPPLYVMLALHAAINIYLFSSSCLDKFNNDDFLNDENSVLIAQIEQMIESLTQSESLTSVGQELIFTLTKIYNEHRRYLQKRSHNQQT